MTGILVVSILAIAALWWVLAPLKGGPRSDAPERDLLVQEAEERKRAALLAILDVEEEHAIGKLSGADLESLRTQYEMAAIEALHELDQLGAGRLSEDDEIEAEIARIRSEMTCPSCGAIRPRAEPCPRCGEV